ncbi:MAG: hypothetical protein JXB49_01150 [Bacteroidales bacterium]|nr:hypothetical protein [Bacteroidales bacterium]
MKTTTVILLFVAFATCNAYPMNLEKADSASERLKSSNELIERVTKLVNEALYKTDNELPEFGKASIVITFGVDYKANFTLINVEGSDQILNYLVRTKLENATIPVDDNLRCKKFIMPVTYEKRPWYEACKKRK